jgi:hypothetical protein
MLKATLPELRAVKAAVDRARACATLMRPGPRLAYRDLYHTCEKRIKRRAANSAYNPFGK